MSAAQQGVLPSKARGTLHAASTCIHGMACQHCVSSLLWAASALHSEVLRHGPPGAVACMAWRTCEVRELLDAAVARKQPHRHTCSSGKAEPPTKPCHTVLLPPPQPACVIMCAHTHALAQQAFGPHARCSSYTGPGRQGWPPTVECDNDVWSEGCRRLGIPH